MLIPLIEKYGSLFLCGVVGGMAGHLLMRFLQDKYREWKLSRWKREYKNDYRD